MLWIIKNDYKPDLILCPSLHDLHQDHRAVADCCLTIFRDTSTILGYEIIRSIGPEFTANVFFILSFKEIEIKKKVIGTYKVQINSRPWFRVDHFIAQCKFRGVQAGAQWAEAYELIWGRIDL